MILLTLAGISNFSFIFETGNNDEGVEVMMMMVLVDTNHLSYLVFSSRETNKGISLTLMRYNDSFKGVCLRVC